MTSPKTLLRAWQIRAQKKLGQHFLTDPSTAKMIISRAGIESEDIVLEIGAGLGALTIPLAGAAKKVFAVEKDHRMVDLLSTELIASNVPNVELILSDILKLNYRDIAENVGRKMIVVGNLPYNISSQILIQLIHSRSFVDRAILMFQKELSQRLMAPPGTRAYGRLTVMLRYCAKVKSIATIDANLFFPAPKVASEILELKFSDEFKYPEHDEAMLFRVIKAAFGNRRKTLKNALAASGLGLKPQMASQALLASGIQPSRRAETLSVQEFIELQINLKKLTPVPM
jgi:16S rRNA (adenine1518-N6/adenine1519-N6)-dimethyltransferase